MGVRDQWFFWVGSFFFGNYTIEIVVLGRSFVEIFRLGVRFQFYQINFFGQKKFSLEYRCKVSLFFLFINLIVN